MDCLRDYIGLTGCGTTVPASGLFINSLPGISLKSIDSLADTEQVNYIGVWNDVQTRGLKRLELMVLSELAKQVSVKAAKFQTSTNNPYSDDDFTGDIDTVTIKMVTDCDSSLQYHWIGQLKFESSFLGDLTVTIYDDNTGEQLYTNTFYPVSSPFTCDINQKFYRRSIRVEIQNAGNHYQSMPIGTIYHQCGYVQFGYTFNGTYHALNDSLGVNLIGYSVGCDLKNMLCDNKSLFALPLWYILGSEMMMERTVSSRVNYWTMDRKQAEELKAYFDVEAEKALKLAFNGITMSDCDCCIDCDPPIAIREARL